MNRVGIPYVEEGFRQPVHQKQSGRFKLLKTGSINAIASYIVES
jgi:hypothetical protein